MPSINSNTDAMYSVNAARKTDREMATAMKRLSSGNRITNAGDDAAGAAISDRMLSQVKGLEMSIRNAGDVISMAQVSEGALGEISDILQRVRELAIQSASDSYNAVERNYLNAEVNQLIAEFDRVTKDTEFNEINVLDGSFASRTFQIGVRKGENASISVSSMRTSSIGAYQQKTDMANTDVDLATGAKLQAAASDTNHVEADTTFKVSGQFGSKTMTVTAGSTARDVATLVNNNFDSTGVDAIASTQLKLEGLCTTGNTGDVSVSFDLYGSNTDAVTISSSVNLAVSKTSSNLTNLRDAINAYSAQTGVEAVLSSDFSNLTLTQPEGYDIKIADTNFDLETSTDTATTALATTGTYAATQAFDVASATGIEVGDFVTLDGLPGGTTVTKVSGVQITVSNSIPSGLEIANGTSVHFSNNERAFVVTGLSEDLTTEGKSVTLIDTQNDNGSNDTALVSGQVIFNSTQQFTVVADTDKGLFSTAPGSADLIKLSTVAVNTRQKALDSLVVLDKALDRINLERAKLGALMSRMTKAIDNLSNVSMNTTESRGRIVDADFALESAKLTKSQILQQSATAMIAQASKSMQTVLDLLR